MPDNETKTVVPKLRFPEFERTGDWQERPLGEHLEESRVEGSHGIDAKKLTVKLWGRGVTKKSETYQGSANTRYYRRKAGQLIYSKLDFLNGAFGIVPKHLDGYESTVDLPCLDIADDLDPDFLLTYVSRPDFYKRFGEIADGGRKAKRIQVETFQSFPIAVPPKKAEQRKIADCLNSLDALVAAQRRKLEALRAHKRGLTQGLFPREGQTRPRLRFTQFCDNEQTRFEPVKGFAEVTTGNKDTQNKVDDGEYPFFVRSQNVARIDSFSHDGEAVLTSGDGVGVGENYHYINGKFDFHQRVYCIYDFDSRVSGEFFFHYFSTHFKKRVKQMSAKNSVDSVRMAMIAEMLIWMPSLAEQQHIAACLSSLDASLAAASAKLAALQGHKKGLTQQLFPPPEGT